MSRRVVPVSTLVHYLKESMDSDPVLHGVMVEGEISNIRKPYSGHWYFSLKDDKAYLSCVMFRYRNQSVAFDPKNGDKVIVKGDVSVYEQTGNMQLVAESMQPSGIGDLYLQFEALKKKLSAEGLFEESHKKPIPPYAMDIALVTGNNTAAREDVLITLHKRWPLAEIHEYPCPVQGAEAAPKIIEALRKADAGNHQLIILARGGGSIEDLWCFNDENLARFIYQMHTPVITGIGHEIDFTLCDYVSDLRANTPTGAAEAAVPDIHEVSASLNQYKTRMIQAVQSDLNMAHMHYQKLASAPVFKNPQKLYSEQAVKLDYLEEKLMHAIHKPSEKRQDLMHLFQTLSQEIHAYSSSIREELQNDQSRLALYTQLRIAKEQNRLNKSRESLQVNMEKSLDKKQERLQQDIRLLDAYSPLKILQRGYSITTENGKALRSITDTEIDDMVSIRLSDGTLEAQVKEKHHG